MHVSRLVCTGCGFEVNASTALPFACPRSRPGDDIDHVLRRELDAAGIGSLEEVRAIFTSAEPNPFLAYRQLLHSYAVGRSAGLSDDELARLVRRLDDAVAGVDGHGFERTPLSRESTLAQRLGVADILVKNETGNVSGTHKGRHLMGIALWLRIAERLFPDSGAAAGRLAIASCGNAALAAGVVARALDRSLETFIPPRADATVIERLRILDAELTFCERIAGEEGDPCYQRFRDALVVGGLPFGCQGPDNALTLDGGRTLAWEMVSSSMESGIQATDIFLQVGGGALASSFVQGLREARALGVLERLPRIFAVQTAAASPLARAWERVVAAVLERHQTIAGERLEAGSEPVRLAEEIRHRVPESTRTSALDHAATHRSTFMWPWEQPGKSVADPIVDDETYDWLEVVRGMLDTAGCPVVVDEARLRAARSLAHETTGIRVSAGGAAGLAGALEMAEDGLFDGSETVALLFTGVERG